VQATPPTRKLERAITWAACGEAADSRSSSASCRVDPCTVVDSAPYSAAAPANSCTVIAGMVCCVVSSIVSSCSAADGAHRALGLDEVLPVHAVAGLLAPVRGAPDVRDRLVVGPGTEGTAQVGLLAGEQAGAHSALGGQPGP